MANKRGVRVKLNNGDVYNATVQDVDQVADIATIKISVKVMIKSRPARDAKKCIMPVYGVGL